MMVFDKGGRTLMMGMRERYEMKLTKFTDDEIAATAGNSIMKKYDNNGI